MSKKSKAIDVSALDAAVIAESKKALKPSDVYNTWLALSDAVDAATGSAEGYLGGLSKAGVLEVANGLLTIADSTKRKSKLATLRAQLDRVNKKRGGEWTIHKAKKDSAYSIGPKHAPRGRKATGEAVDNAASRIAKARAGGEVTLVDVLDLVVQFTAGLNRGAKEQVLAAIEDVVLGGVILKQKAA